jgi:tRNA pseudouridine32 synthase/23S rRNA pseudouridine746 synthase
MSLVSSSLSLTPPMRHGVSASQVFLPRQAPYLTTFAFLCAKFPHISVSEWQQRFMDALVLTQTGQALSLESPYLSEQHIFYYRQLPDESPVPFEHEVLFENADLLVVDKPHFLTVSPTGHYVQQTLLTRLKQHTGNADLSPIHRLDRETAGVILISKNKVTRGIYQQLFAQKRVHKTYHAIAAYTADLCFPLNFSARLVKGEPFYTMRISEGPHNSSTDIKCLAHAQSWAKYELTPLTGKQHQLRVHMNALGLPLKNDRLYPRIQHDQESFSQPLQLLAKSLSFKDPLSLQMLYFESKRDIYLSS